jgi:multidrug resistance efflux pump
MRNLKLEQDADRSRADLSLAEANTRRAQLDYEDLGRARNEQASQSEHYQSVYQQLAVLEVFSPISGVVVTPRIRNLAGSYVAAGTELAEVDDLQGLKARIFVPDFELRRVALGAAASLKLESQFRPILGRVTSISPAPMDLPTGLFPVEPYQGLTPPPHYVATVLLPNVEETIRAGMSGDAKIEVRRRSLAWFLWENLREFVQRKTW